MNLILASKIGGVICAIGGVVATAILIPWSGDGSIPLSKDKVFVYATIHAKNVPIGSLEEINHSKPNFQCRVVTYGTNNEDTLSNSTSGDDLFDCSLSKLPKIDIEKNALKVVDSAEYTKNKLTKDDLGEANNTFQVKSGNEKFWSKLSADIKNTIQIVSSSSSNNIYATLFPSFAKYKNDTKVFNAISFIGKASTGQGVKWSDKKTIVIRTESSETWVPKIFNCSLSVGASTKENCYVQLVSTQTNTDDLKKLSFKNIDKDSESLIAQSQYYVIFFTQYASPVLPNVTVKPKSLTELDKNATISLYEQDGNDPKIEFTNITAVINVQGHLNIL